MTPRPGSTVQRYLELSQPDQSSSESVATLLNAIVAELSNGFQLSESTRRSLLRSLLSSVPELVAEHEPSTLLNLATCLKLLGRSNEGTEILARPEGLSALLRLAETKQYPVDATEQHAGQDQEEQGGDLTALPVNQLAPHSAEALRCLANTLTLQPSAREAVPPVLLEGPLHGLVSLLEHQGWASFLSARILFLATAGSQSSELVSYLVDSRCISSMHRYATAYLGSLQDSPASLSGTMPNASDVLREHFKLAYNIMLQYGRHVAKSSTAKTESSSAGGDGSASLTRESCKPFLPLFQPYYKLSCLLPLYTSDTKPQEPSPLVLSALNTLLNYPIELEELDHGWKYSWFQPLSNVVGDSVDANEATPSSLPLFKRVLAILDTCCKSWFPFSMPTSAESSSSLPSVDDLLVGPDMSASAARAEEVLGPILLLLRKLTMLSDPADRLNNLVFPQDLDRSVPLSYHPGLTGHLVRLASSIMLPNSACGAIELIYNLCGREPEQLARAVGYGLASGWLQSRGELIPPPAAPSSRDQGENKGGPATANPLINPITGAQERAVDLSKVAEMTDEEKEREAERLFVLFERMERTGVMSAENPVAKAQREGKFEELKDEELRKQKDQEDEAVEAEVAREMEAYRARKQRTQGQKE